MGIPSKDAFFCILSKKCSNLHFPHLVSFLVFIVSNCELRVPRISSLKFSKRFPNSILVTPPEVNLFILASLIPFPLLSLLQEYFLQRVQISSKVNWEISPDPIRLSISIYSSCIPLRNIVLNVLVFNICLYFL